MSCNLCSIFSKKGADIYYNKIIFETRRFVLVPSIGPLDLGHVLIVSKSHVCGLAAMDQESILELFSFLNFLRLKNENSDTLFFEHGSFDNNSAGSCIDHTHIHVIPKYGQYYNIFDNTNLNTLSVELNIENFKKIDFPYIMCFNSLNDFRLYEAYNVHSQMMRVAICNKRSETNWDWKKDENPKLIAQSIEFWENNLR